MENFKDNDINAMSIIVDSVKYHLIPYISHLDSSKKMYDALTNNIVTNLTRTLQSSRFLGGQVFYLIFKNGATGSTPLHF